MTVRSNGISGRELRQVRRMADLSQEDVARAIGVGRTRIAHVEAMANATSAFAARYLRAVDELQRRAAGQ